MIDLRDIVFHLLVRATVFAKYDGITSSYYAYHPSSNRVGAQVDRYYNNDIEGFVHLLNDKMDQIDSQIRMMNISLSSQVQGVAHQLQNTKQALESLEKRVDFYHPQQWIYYPPGTTKHRAKKYYPQHNLKFIGYGLNKRRDEDMLAYQVTFETCLVRCVENRAQKGDEWNGIQYRWAWRLCMCVKKSQGFQDIGHDLNYKFQ